MLDQLASTTSFLFCFTTILTLLFLFKASRNNKICLLIAVVWLCAQAILGLSEFYAVTDTFPPRIFLIMAPPFITIILLFSIKKGRVIIDKFNPITLTWLHTVRIPVEIVLFLLAGQKLLPDVMTFEGRNFDIIAGITAPLIAWYGMHKKLISRSLLITWNFICLGLLINVVTHGLLSIPSIFQQISFDQPNISMLFFPMVWLPAFIVPVVFFSHLVNIRYLVIKK
jgi:hypothetical protein